MKLEEVKAKALSFFAEKGLDFSLVDDCGWCAERARIVLQTLGLKTKVIRDSFDVELKTTFLGRKISFPIMPAPLSGIIKAIDPNCFERIVNESFALGVIPWIGYPVEREDIKNLKDFIWIIKPLKDRKMLYAEIELAEKFCFAVGIDLDCFAYENVCGSLQSYEFLKPISYDELRDLAAATKLPFIAKGVLSERDYVLAEKAGCDAVVVSNRGGRVLNSAVSPIEIIQRIEKSIITGVDSFIRSGEDVLKALALGADFVLIGRPVAWGLAIPNGVRAVLELFRDELRNAMLACGVKSVAELSKDLIIPL